MNNYLKYARTIPKNMSCFKNKVQSKTYEDIEKSDTFGVKYHLKIIR